MVVASACGSEDSNGATPESGRCAQWGDNGCICRTEPREGDVAFNGTCDQSGVGEPSVCCKSKDSCHCEAVQCGISSIGGECLCGIGVSFDNLVDSCTGTATTCCTQDTGYCYCEDGCENRFANRVVSSCDRTTSAATCSSGETEVSSCQ